MLNKCERCGSPMDPMTAAALDFCGYSMVCPNCITMEDRADLLNDAEIQADWLDEIGADSTRVREMLQDANDEYWKMMAERKAEQQGWAGH